ARHGRRRAGAGARRGDARPRRDVLPRGPPGARAPGQLRADRLDGGGRGQSDPGPGERHGGAGRRAGLLGARPEDLLTPAPGAQLLEPRPQCRLGAVLRRLVEADLADLLGQVALLDPAVLVVVRVLVADAVAERLGGPVAGVADRLGRAEV